MTRTRAPGHQLAINWETSTEHSTRTPTIVKPKEEHLLRHMFQGSTSYCALYALAILEELDIDEVIKTAKRQCSIIRKRSRYTGRFNQIRATYAALGYTFPFSGGLDKEVRRIKNRRPEHFTGKGHARLTKRKKSTEGHQICYKDGIIYDSAQFRRQTAEVFLATTKYTWIVIRKTK